MSDSRQPTQEELRAYVEQLRAADPAELIVQAYSMLATGAEVKLGRRDARPLIDAIAGLVDGVDGKVEGELTRQMRNGVTQLQMAQVQAEQQLGREEQAGAEPQEARQEQADSRQAAGEPVAGGQQPPGEQSSGDAAQGRRMTDRLWVPGRGDPPRPG